MEKGLITVERQARYFRLGPTVEEAEAVWYLLHGYGQVADEFLAKFEALDDGRTTLIAAEGLSRF